MANEQRIKGGELLSTFIFKGLALLIFITHHPQSYFSLSLFLSVYLILFLSFSFTPSLKNYFQLNQVFYLRFLLFFSSTHGKGVGYFWISQVRDKSNKKKAKKVHQMKVRKRRRRRESERETPIYFQSDFILIELKLKSQSVC